MGLINHLPWWVRLGGKLVLSRLPVPYRVWRTLGLFRHGDMNRPEHAIATFQNYMGKVRDEHPLRQGFTSLELGPGDSVLAGLAARAMGAGRVWLMDAGAYAETDVRVCQEAVELLRSLGAAPPDIAGCANLAEVLRRSDITYLTDGVAALKAIPTASVDFVWSQVVLEHVPVDELDALLTELRRVVRDNAIGIHGVDFRDHLGGGLNNLRFSERTWESGLFRHSGFYTNRIRCHDMVARFEAAGFSVLTLRETRWSKMPLPPARMALPYRNCALDNLLIAEAELLIRPKA